MQEAKFIQPEELKTYGYNPERGCYEKEGKRFFITCFSMGNNRYIMMRQIG